MKQLKIKYNVYNQHDVLVFTNIFSTTYNDELPESILKSSLNILKHGAGAGYYAITDIETVPVSDDISSNSDALQGRHVPHSEPKEF